MGQASLGEKLKGGGNAEKLKRLKLKAKAES